MADCNDPSKRFREAFEAADLTVDELWLRYFGLGGSAGRMEVDAYVNGAMALQPFEHDMLAHAINERLAELTPPKAPYSDEFYESGLFDLADDE
jgi:hypothetical protein